MFWNFIIICCTLCIDFNETSSEYFIQNEKGTNFLETSFNDTDDLIFSFLLKINFILFSFNDGLLFYGIDRSSNQLIVTIKHSIEFSMQIEFRGNRDIINFKRLCKCITCLHEKLSFQFLIKDSIEIKCNQYKAVDVSFQQRKHFVENYPLPRFDMNDKISAYLWLINIPKYRNGDSITYPNNGHLEGRFSGITYRDRPLNLSIVGSSDRCNNLCTDDLCNGGKCLETFQCKPVCDCTETFLNGEFCNSSISSYGISNTNISFRLLKLSWSGFIGEIFKISNKNIIFGVSILSSTILQFVFENNFTSKIKFPGNYSRKDQFVFLITFKEKFIEIRFTNGINKWKNHNISNDIDFKMEHFNEIKFLNQSGGNIAYKTFADDLKLHLINGVFEPFSMKTFPNSTITEACFAKSKGLNATIATLAIINLVTIVILIFVLHKKNKLRRFADASKPNVLYELAEKETFAMCPTVENDPINTDFSNTGDVFEDVLKKPKAKLKENLLQISIAVPGYEDSGYASEVPHNILIKYDLQ